MESKITITADISINSADAPLGLEVWVDDVLLQNIDPVIGTAVVSVEVDDTNDAEHELKFVLKNKTPEHTTIDESGNIVKDTVLEIKNIKFDELELGHMFYEQAIYHHNFNGNGPEIADDFYGIMGCNGSVILKFATPIYLWLLENM